MLVRDRLGHQHRLSDYIGPCIPNGPISHKHAVGVSVRKELQCRDSGFVQSRVKRWVPLISRGRVKKIAIKRDTTHEQHRRRGDYDVGWSAQWGAPQRLCRLEREKLAWPILMAVSSGTS